MVAAAAAGQPAHVGKTTWIAVLSCVVGSCTGLLMGYENGIAGGVAAFPAFQAAFFPSVAVASAAHSAGTARGSAYCKYDDPGLALFLACVYLASCVGAVAGSFVSPRWGRKATMLLSAAVFVAGAVLQGAAVNVGMVVAGRVLLGLGMGAADQVGPQYVSECAPPWLRGRLNSLFQLAVIVGFCLSNVVNFVTLSAMDPSLGWRLSLGLAGVPAVLLLAVVGLLPDSPSSLAERGRHAQSEAVLARLRGTKDVAAELVEIRAAAELAGLHHQWRALLSRRCRPQLIIDVAIPTFQVLAGFQAVIFAPQVFEAVGVRSIDAVKFTVIIGVTFVVFTLVAVALADMAGRRALFQSSGVLCFAAMLALGVLLAVFSRPGATPPSMLSTAVLALVCLYVAGFSWGWGPMAWLAPSELSPLECRAAGTATAVVANHAVCFILALAFMRMLCALQWGLFLFFAGWLVVMTVFVQLCLPESRNIPIEEVHRVFEEHWLWGRVMCRAGGAGSPALPRSAKDAASPAVAAAS